MPEPTSKERFQTVLGEFITQEKSVESFQRFLQAYSFLKTGRRGIEEYEVEEVLKLHSKNKRLIWKL